MGGTVGTQQSGAGLPRRLLGGALSSLWIVAAVVAGWLLWPSSLGGCTTLTIVSGHSMEPTYYTGDLVVSRCGDVGIGDVVVYSPPGIEGARIIHRIVDGDAEGWIIQGDNNDFLDPWTPTAEHILGSAVLHIPKMGLFASILLSPMTWVSVIVIALAVVIWPNKDEDAVEGKGRRGPGEGPPPNSGPPEPDVPPEDDRLPEPRQEESIAILAGVGTGSGDARAPPGTTRSHAPAPP